MCLPISSQTRTNPQLHLNSQTIVVMATDTELKELSRNMPLLDDTESQHSDGVKHTPSKRTVTKKAAFIVLAVVAAVAISLSIVFLGNPNTENDQVTSDNHQVEGLYNAISSQASQSPSMTFTKGLLGEHYENVTSWLSGELSVDVEQVNLVKAGAASAVADGRHCVRMTGSAQILGGYFNVHAQWKVVNGITQFFLKTVGATLPNGENGSIDRT